MPEPISGIGASQALTDLLGLTGKLPLQLESFIVPVVMVGDVDSAVQWGPRAWGKLYMAAVIAPDMNTFEIALPAGSEEFGRRAIIDHVYITPGQAMSLTCVPSPGMAAPTSTAIKAWADTRTRGLPQVLINAKNDAAAIGGNTPINWYCPANVLTDLALDWIIGPNPDTGVQQGLYFESSIRTATLTINVTWRESPPR